MVQTCGSYLSQFALSVDSVDAQTYNNVQNLLERYFEKTLGVSFFAILVDGIRVETAGGIQPGLRTLWSNRQVVDAIPIIGEGGAYSGMRAFAFHKDKPLWVTAGDKGLIGLPEAALIDAWSNTPELPRYLEKGESDAKTAILVPLRYGGRVFGVLILEFPKAFEFSFAARDEIRVIADALARVIWLHDTTATQVADTQRAFKQLEELFTASSRPLTKPSLFVASASNADDAVMGCILTALADFSDQIHTLYWKDFSDHGNISAKLLEVISRSVYGVCYLSEKVANHAPGAHPYRDNPNALFEAGMLQALTNDPAALPKGWIPIREHQDLTGPTPFDFAQERMIIVPRLNGEVNKHEFNDVFNRMIKSMIE